MVKPFKLIKRFRACKRDDVIYVPSITIFPVHTRQKLALYVLDEIFV